MSLSRVARSDKGLVLTVNVGSSSVKLAVYEAGPELKLVLSAKAEHLGDAGGLRIETDDTSVTEGGVRDHESAVSAFLSWLNREWPDASFRAVGHRIVHGGPLTAPTRLTSDVRELLGRLVPLAPDHLPQALSAIAAIDRRLPGVTQIACFDTAFHRTLPQVARMLALPRDLVGDDVRRYGFHGLSYEYVVGELRRIAPAQAGGRLIVAHLGNGASMAAIHSGASIETTMGFTPAAGLVMSTRSGDLDPGVLVYLAERDDLDAPALRRLINEEAGLLGVSAISGDVEELLASDDVRAAEALDLFCYQARKCVGALTAVLGGLETLVFTAGIGENAPSIRWRICAGLHHLGVELDPEANGLGVGIVSAAASRVTVRVIRTNEDLVVARLTRDALEEGGA